jgi:hypothetical protein
VFGSLFEGSGILLPSICVSRWVGDLWCGNRPLKLCYPALYTIARFPDAWVVDNLSVVGGVAHWNVLFTCYAQD